MYKYFNKKNNINKGFSLVEMLVAIAIFMSIMTVAISALISIINATKRAQAIKSTIDNVTFALESISRDMRTGYEYQCMTPEGQIIPGTKDCLSGSPVVRYKVSDGSKYITYKYSTTSVLSKLVRNSSVCLAGASTYTCPEDLISEDSNVNITSMNFYVFGADCEFGGASCTQGKTQPRVIITASGLISSKGSADTTFNLQTNISQRVRR